MDDAEYQNRHCGVARAVPVPCRQCGMVEIPVTSYAQGILCPMCKKCLLCKSNNNSHAGHITQRSSDDRERCLLRSEVLPHSSQALPGEGIDNASDKLDCSLVRDYCDGSALDEPEKTTSCTCTTSAMAAMHPDYVGRQNQSISTALEDLSFRSDGTPQQETCSGYDGNLSNADHVRNMRTSKTPTEDDLEQVTKSDVGGLEFCSKSKSLVLLSFKQETRKSGDSCWLRCHRVSSFTYFIYKQS